MPGPSNVVPFGSVLVFVRVPSIEPTKKKLQWKVEVEADGKSST